MTASFFSGIEPEGVAAVDEPAVVATPGAAVASADVDEVVVSLASAAGLFTGASKAAISIESL
jgi:hypothetical protein